MSFIYSSNSPHFLDYLASCKTRNEILNDPQLCVFLNDPHIKDNMELALLARAADYGDYDAKVEFVGFFLANGPELDTDTIMHYRKKILLDYTYSRIAKDEFSDISKVDDLRVNTYGKETTESAAAKGKEDDGNCFKNPCDYLQPISSMIGMLGDSENFKTINNIFARNNKESQEEKDKKESKDDEATSNNTWGNIRKHVAPRIVPEFNKGYHVMLKNMSMQSESLKQKIKEANLEKETQTIGDAEAEKVAENIAPAVKMNIFKNMGDCARLWEYLRRFNVYNPTQNAKGPIDDSDLNTKKTVQGTPKNAPGIRNDATLATKPKPTQVESAGANPSTGRSKSDIVMAFARTDYNSVEKINEIWYTVADKCGWEEITYAGELQALITKTNNKNPYYQPSTAQPMANVENITPPDIADIRQSEAFASVEKVATKQVEEAIAELNEDLARESATKTIEELNEDLTLSIPTFDF